MKSLGSLLLCLVLAATVYAQPQSAVDARNDCIDARASMWGMMSGADTAYQEMEAAKEGADPNHASYAVGQGHEADGDEMYEDGETNVTTSNTQYNQAEIYWALFQWGWAEDCYILSRAFAKRDDGLHDNAYECFEQAKADYEDATAAYEEAQ